MTIKTCLVLGLLSSKQLQEIEAVKQNSPKVLVTGNNSRDCTEEELASCLEVKMQSLKHEFESLVFQGNTSNFCRTQP